jgi:hypothetical protein
VVWEGQEPQFLTLVGRKGKQWVGLRGIDDGEEAAKGTNGAKHGAWDRGNGDFNGRAIELARFGEAETKDGTLLDKMDIVTFEVAMIQKIFWSKAMAWAERWNRS